MDWGRQSFTEKRVPAVTFREKAGGHYMGSTFWEGAHWTTAWSRMKGSHRSIQFSRAQVEGQGGEEEVGHNAKVVYFKIYFKTRL